MQPNHSSDTTYPLGIDSPLTGSSVLASLLALARRSLKEMPRALALPGDRFAATGRIRGTGPGVSFSAAVAALEHAWPVELVFPFEGSALVGGAAWPASELLGPDEDAAAVKLRWEPGADDLPMHTHTSSDRFIVVLQGRGFYHVSGQSVETFDGSNVRTIAARQHDVFAFTRDVVHTFSTSPDEGMTLLSVHLPFVPLDDPKQYALPHFRWTARERLDASDSRITAGGWSPLVA